MTHSAEARPQLSMTNKELLSYLHPDLFIPDLKARNKLEAIQKMVAHLVETRRIRDGRIVLEAIKTREKLGSTGIGKGVAVPHSRCTVTGDLTLLFARSVDGVDYDAIDEKPVHLFFMILAPHQDKNSEYLPLLGKLVEITRDATVRRRLLKTEEFPDIAEAIEKGRSK